jgi:hypothetical protein
MSFIKQVSLKYLVNHVNVIERSGRGMDGVCMLLSGNLS